MRWLRPLVYLWVFPASLLGLLLVPTAFAGQGGIRLVDGVLEVYGGLDNPFEREAYGQEPSTP